MARTLYVSCFQTLIEAGRVEAARARLSAGAQDRGPATKSVTSHDSGDGGQGGGQALSPTGRERVSNPALSRKVLLLREYVSGEKGACSC